MGNVFHAELDTGIAFGIGEAEDVRVSFMGEGKRLPDSLNFDAHFYIHIKRWDIGEMSTHGVKLICRHFKSADKMPRYPHNDDPDNLWHVQLWECRGHAPQMQARDYLLEQVVAWLHQPYDDRQTVGDYLNQLRWRLVTLTLERTDVVYIRSAVQYYMDAMKDAQTFSPDDIQSRQDIISLISKALEE